MNYKLLYLKYKTKYLKEKYRLNGGETKIKKVVDIVLNKVKQIKVKNAINLKYKIKKTELFKLFSLLENMSLHIRNKYNIELHEICEYLHLNYINHIENNSYVNINNFFISGLLQNYLDKNDKNHNALKKYILNNSDIKMDNNKESKYKYKSHELLGTGSFGSVYKVNDDIVIKIINIESYTLDLYDKFKSINSIINEINIQKSLNNTDISAKILDYWIQDVTGILEVCIVMENKGISLLSWLDDGNSLNNMDKKIIKKKLDILHEKNIIHNDFYERNILIEEKNNKRDFYITDFGLSHTKETLLEHYKEIDKQNYNLITNQYSNTFRFIMIIMKLLNLEIIMR